jgi:hypothetical protein
MLSWLGCAIVLALAFGYYFGKCTFRGIGLESVTASQLAAVIAGLGGDPNHRVEIVPEAAPSRTALSI